MGSAAALSSDNSKYLSGEKMEGGANAKADCFYNSSSLSVSFQSTCYKAFCKQEVCFWDLIYSYVSVDGK